MDIGRISIAPLFRDFETSRETQFWGLQLGGWGGLCIVTFLSLTVWYGTPNWRHVSHTLIQAGLGVLLTLPLRLLYKRIWERALLNQFLISIVSIIIISAIWTALRMQAFLWLGEEYDIWKDFGGWYFGSFMVFSSWTALYFGVKFYQLLQAETLQRSLATQKMQDEQLKRLSAETGAREAQNKMLRYQLNPHFLFNTLNSISALVKTQRTDQARGMISQLSDFLRFSLDTDATQKVTLEDEIQALELYLDIEKVRYEDRLKAEFDISDDTRGACIPSLILQPLLENALKFAVAGRIGGGTIRIRARRNADMLVLSVDDSGPGMDKQFYADGDVSVLLESGVGLQNVSKRLRSHYEDAGELKFHSSDLGGLSVVIRIPCEMRDNHKPADAALMDI